ncbi:class I SAM-dependent methyltransferase, partial [Chloroflexota bacterium]
FVAANGEALPLADSAFDLVVCNCVLEHIGNDGAAPGAMARALRPGGILFLTVDNREHGLALGFLDHLPANWKARILWAQVADAPTVSGGLDARLDSLYAVLRRYRRDELAGALTDEGLTLLDSQSYLSGVGAAHYEAFHAICAIDPARRFGRILWMLSSLLLYPLAAWSDNRRTAKGHGLAFVARKGESPGTE